MMATQPSAAWHAATWFGVPLQSEHLPGMQVQRSKFASPPDIEPPSLGTVLDALLDDETEDVDLDETEDDSVDETEVDDGVVLLFGVLAGVLLVTLLVEVVPGGLVRVVVDEDDERLRLLDGWAPTGPPSFAASPESAAHAATTQTQGTKTNAWRTERVRLTFGLL
jgi:hypothetical protein